MLFLGHGIWLLGKVDYVLDISRLLLVLLILWVEVIGWDAIHVGYIRLVAKCFGNIKCVILLEFMSFICSEIVLYRAL